MEARLPLVVEFQQYATDVKRKATSNPDKEEDTTNERDTQELQQESSSAQDAPVVDMHAWDSTSSLFTFEPAWGTGPMYDDKTEDTS